MLFTAQTSNLLSSIVCVYMCVVQGYYDLANLRLYLLPVGSFEWNSVCLNQSIRIISFPFCYFLLFWLSTSAPTSLADSIRPSAYWLTFPDGFSQWSSPLGAPLTFEKKMAVRANNLHPHALTIPLKTLHVWCVLRPCRRRNAVACIRPASCSHIHRVLLNLQERLQDLIPDWFVIPLIYHGYLIFHRQRKGTVDDVWVRQGWYLLHANSGLLYTNAILRFLLPAKM